MPGVWGLVPGVVLPAKFLSIKSYQSDQLHYRLLESDHWFPNRRLCSGHKSNDAPRDPISLSATLFFPL